MREVLQSFEVLLRGAVERLEVSRYCAKVEDKYQEKPFLVSVFYDL